MSKVSVELEIPEGYEFCRIGVPLKGEKYITLGSQIVKDEPCYKSCIVLTKKVRLSSLGDGQLFQFDRTQDVCKKIVPFILCGELGGYLYTSLKNGVTYLYADDAYVIPVNGDKNE